MDCATGAQSFLPRDMGLIEQLWVWNEACAKGAFYFSCGSARFPTSGEPSAVATSCFPTSCYFNISWHGVAFELATDQLAHDCTSYFVTKLLHPQNFKSVML